jgi:oligopeptidase B
MRAAALPLVVSLAAASAASEGPPVAARRPHEVVSPHGTRTDPYYWLRDDTRSNPEVLRYLEAEQAYYRAESARWAPFTETLYGEFVARLKQNDDTVPVKIKDYLDYTRFETG